MASSSGNSSVSITQLQSSEDQDMQQQLLMEQRKRKRKQSNRESARRSRMRKHNHLNELKLQVVQLRKDNNQILSNINITTQQYLSVEADNSILRAQMMELTHRLGSLIEILNAVSNNNTASSGSSDDLVSESNDNEVVNNNDPFNDFVYLNQRTVASADLFQYR